MGFSEIEGISTTSSIVAEYKSGTWRKAGSLMQGRFNHAAITVEDTIMIIGGCVGGVSGDYSQQM